MTEHPVNGIPLITIGMTCFNARDTIHRAVDGALAQTWPKRDILIVDDGSTDGSQAILQELEDLHSNIRVVRHKENRGFPSALNTLLAEARGEFIAFFDDDDESSPERLQAQYERLIEYEKSHPGASVLCYSNRRIVKAGRESRRFGIGRVPPEPSGPIVADFVLGLVKDDGHHCWGMFGSGTLLARTDTLRDAGGFDVAFRRCAELDFVVRVAFYGAHFISVDAPLMTQHITSKAEKAGHADLQYRLKLLQKYQEYLKTRRAYVGARCNAHAQFHCGRHWWWRLWYLGALACFPFDISGDRLRGSSLLTRLIPLPRSRSAERPAAG